MKKIAIYPGTFKPFHEGHLTILEKALKVFDEVYVVPSINIRKKRWKQKQQTREAQINAMVKTSPRCFMLSPTWRCWLLILLCPVGAQFIIRGLRSKKDLEYELDMYDANKNVEPRYWKLFIFVANLGETQSLINHIAGNWTVPTNVRR
jgi:pantetheine-phosphate adenylyltransferase